MIDLRLTNEEAYLLGAIFRASSKQRQQAADMMGDHFDWSQVNLDTKIENAECEANLSMLEVVAIEQI
jgi:hypothetical protein